MSYSDFENRLLLAFAAAAADGSHIDAFTVAETVGSVVEPEVNEQLVRDAVRSFEQQGYFHSVVRGQRGSISMMITAEGRKAAERLKERPT